MHDLILNQNINSHKSFRTSEDPVGTPIEHPIDASTGVKKESICCVACSHVITNTSYVIKIEGQHIHFKKNPSGIEFLFGCFTSATGCKKSGTPRSDASWFNGCLWNLAHCQRCNFQLGWYFSGHKRFYALILDHIKECGDKPT